MDKDSIAALIAAVTLCGGGLFAFARWAMAEWRGKTDADRAERLTVRKDDAAERAAVRLEDREDRAADREVQREATRAMFTLALKVESLDAKLTTMADAWDTVSGVHDVPPPDHKAKKRAQTKPHGVREVGGG